MSDINNSNGQMKLREWWRVVVGAINALSRRIDNIITQSGTSSTEVVDARNSNTGTTYTTLKARLDDAFNNINKLHLSKSTLTISADAITVSKGYHVLETEGGASTDDLSTINGGNEGDILILRPASSSRKVVVKLGVGNIWGFDVDDIELNSGASTLILLKHGTNLWSVVGSQGVRTSTDQTIYGIKTFLDQVRFGADQLLVFQGRSSDTANKKNYRFDINGAVLKLQAMNDSLGWTRDLLDISHDGNFIKFNNIYIYQGTGSPEGTISAPVGSIFLRTDGGANTTLYVKQTGTGNTGWTAK